MNKTSRCYVRNALSQRSTHSESARFARNPCAKRLLPHVWTLVKCPQMLELARHLRPLDSLFVILCGTVVGTQTCMNKTSRCYVRNALSQRSTHSESARFARNPCAKRLLPHVWTLVKCPQMLELARHLRPLDSLFYSLYPVTHKNGTGKLLPMHTLSECAARSGWELFIE